MQRQSIDKLAQNPSWRTTKSLEHKIERQNWNCRGWGSSTWCIARTQLWIRGSCSKANPYIFATGLLLPEIEICPKEVSGSSRKLEMESGQKFILNLTSGTCKPADERPHTHRQTGIATLILLLCLLQHLCIEQPCANSHVVSVIEESRNLCPQLNISDASYGFKITQSKSMSYSYETGMKWHDTSPDACIKRAKPAKKTKRIARCGKSCKTVTSHERK